MTDNWQQYLEYKSSKLPIMSGHTYYAPLLSSNSKVIDLGGSTAAFSRALASLYGCKCYVVEASSQNFLRIVETELVSKFNYAITGVEGKVKIWIADDHYHWGSIHRAKNFSYANSEDVDGITFESFLDKIRISSPDLVKVDIEGAELEFFSTTTDKILQSIGQLTVEFHDFLSPDMGNDIVTIKERMVDLGFQVFSFGRQFNGDVLFLNSRATSLSRLEAIKIAYGQKYFRGFKRLTKRLI